MTFKLKKRRKFASFSRPYLIGIIFIATLITVIAIPSVHAVTDEEVRRDAQNDIQFYVRCASGSSNKKTTTSNSASISGSAAAEKVWTGLISKHYTPEIVAGIMGNMQAESGFNPARYEGKYKDVWESGFEWETDTANGHGVGLVQWSGVRRVNFFNYMRQEGNTLVDNYLKKPNTYGGLSGDDFIKKAANDSEVNGLYSLELNFLDQELTTTSDYKGIFDQKTPEDAAKFFAKYVEVCAACEDNSDTMQKRIDAANEIYAAFSGKTAEGGESAPITGDYSNILAAKNANESVGGVTSDSEWYAGWNDGNTEEMKRILEHYGDLAYQTGRAINVPWQAIIVQMRYENPWAKCGSEVTPNNFWGMGCSGNLKRAKTENLGQGFATYAEWVTNGNYDNAIGLTDPYEYLATLGPVWVQGPCGGYCELASMKKSIESLQEFIDSPEGQAIVQQFGSYTGMTSGTASDDCCDPSTSALSAAGGGIYQGQKYPLSDEDLRTLIRIAIHENSSSLTATKTSLSQMANLYDRHPGYSDILDYVINGKWYQTADENCSGSTRTCSYNDEISDELFKAAKDIIVEGHRTIPLQVYQHFTFGSQYSMIMNDGQEADADDRSQYKSGVTVVYEGHSTNATHWVFWNWADPEKQTGDPFGYGEDDPPPASAQQPIKGSSSKTNAGSSVTWSDDGWINSGMNGYSKMELSTTGDPDMFGAKYTTKSPNGHDPGPNKITLHAFEGVGGNENTIKSIYAKGFPPHFTIDLKNHKVYQHTSIWNASAAIKGSTDGDQAAGVQIEILGYDNFEQAGENTDWYLGSEEAFSDDDFAYLAELLNAISVETGIPLTSTVEWNGVKDNIRLTPEKFVEYQGILAHKHTPARDDVDDGSENDGDHDDLVDDVIWTRIQKALQGKTESQQTTECPPAGGVDEAAIQNLVKEWVWRKDEPNWDQPIRKDAYDKVIQRRSANGDYVGDPATPGIDCGGFVTTLMQESGWDSGYNPDKGGTDKQHAYLKSSPKWDEVTSTIHSNSDAKVGDVLIKENEGDSWHHTLVYVGKIPGFNFSEMAEAGQRQYAPSEGLYQDIMYWVRDQGFHVYRNNTPPTSGGGTIGEGGLTEADAKKFMMNYGENKNGSSESAVGNSLWCMCGSPCSGGSNCVTFSAFFLNKFTKTPYAGGSGFAVAGALNTTVDDKPSVWSVFSYGSGCSGTSAQGCVNHTGVILGKQGNTWIVGHASCTRGNNGIAGKGDGTMNGGGSGYVITSDDINAAIGNSTGKSVRYAHPQGVDTSAISNYLTNGT